MPKEEKVKLKKIAIVGNPNVGKSVLFNALTKMYVDVSNYPGTTVEVSRGRIRIGENEYEVVDTPGMYGLLSITEEEKVARRILIEEEPFVVMHVVDAKNLERMLSLTLQLTEASFKVVLVLNMMDEAEKEGIVIDFKVLEKELSIPVVGAVSTTGKGIDEIKREVDDYAKRL